MLYNNLIYNRKNDSELSDSINIGEFLVQIRNCQLFKRNHAPWSYCLIPRGRIVPHLLSVIAQSVYFHIFMWISGCDEDTHMDNKPSVTSVFVCWIVLMQHVCALREAIVRETRYKKKVLYKLHITIIYIFGIPVFQKYHKYIR